METTSKILDLSFDFSIKIIGLYKELIKRNEYVLSKQLLRCATSIGANVEEAIGGASRKDFINKMQIAYKEARETKYWLRLLNEGELIDKKLAESFLKDCEEILKILTAILNSSKVSA